MELAVFLALCPPMSHLMPWQDEQSLDLRGATFSADGRPYTGAPMP